MATVLFLGNSHVSAFKVAYDAMDKQHLPECGFFCARGADLAFTEVISGRLRSKPEMQLDEETIRFGYSDWAMENLVALYRDERRPMGDVDRQFVTTGGKAEIELEGIAAIVYVVGVSPYDFVRLHEPIAPMSSSLRRRLLGRMLDEKFLLRRQVEAIRCLHPACKHLFIGTPLLATPPVLLTEAEKLAVVENRSVVQSLARDFLFDDVFMPGEDLLDDSLLATKASFTRGGRQESEVFQGGAPTQSDLSHMNADYGTQVFRAFIEPRLRAFPIAEHA